MYEYKITLQRVIDGDSAIIDIDFGFNLTRKNVGFRLFGLQAPELRSSLIPEKWLAERATTLIREHFIDGEEYVLHSAKDETGKFGRVLGNLYNESISWRWVLEESGICVPYGTPKEQEYERWEQLYGELS